MSGEVPPAVPLTLPRTLETVRALADSLVEHPFVDRCAVVLEDGEISVEFTFRFPHQLKPHTMRLPGFANPESALVTIAAASCLLPCIEKESPQDGWTERMNAEAKAAPSSDREPGA